MYKGFDEAITRPHGIVMVGYPGTEMENLSTISAQTLTKMAQRLQRKPPELTFKQLSADEHQEWLNSHPTPQKPRRRKKRQSDDSEGSGVDEPVQKKGRKSKKSRICSTDVVEENRTDSDGDVADTFPLVDATRLSNIISHQTNPVSSNFFSHLSSGQRIEGEGSSGPTENPFAMPPFAMPPINDAPSLNFDFTTFGGSVGFGYDQLGEIPLDDQFFRDITEVRQGTPPRLIDVRGATY